MSTDLDSITNEIESLKKQIEIMRAELIQTGMQNGFTDIQTVTISEKLDLLLNKLFRLKVKTNEN